VTNRRMDGEITVSNSVLLHAYRCVIKMNIKMIDKTVKYKND